jgi:N-acetyl-gamma-glutamylphosphate reductase
MKHAHEPEIEKVQDCDQQEVKVQLTPDKAQSRVRWNQQSKLP